MDLLILLDNWKEHLVLGFKSVKMTNIWLFGPPCWFFLTGLSAIVRPSSMKQSTKGIFTAGKNFGKSMLDVPPGLSGLSTPD